MSERPAVVFDTDVYVNALVGPDSDWPYLAGVLSGSTNPDADCLSIAFDASGLRLMTSPHILTNVSGALRHLGVGAGSVKATIAAVLDIVRASGGAVVDAPRQVFDLPGRWNNLLMDLVLAVDAALLVTDDADLTELGPWQGIPVLRLRQLHRPGPTLPGR